MPKSFAPVGAKAYPMPEAIPPPATCLNHFEPDALADLSHLIWAVPARSLDAALVLALHAKTPECVQRVWRRLLELFDPMRALWEAWGIPACSLQNAPTQRSG